MKIQHKLFKIKITNGKIYENQKVFKEINNFLERNNYVYINHSITTIAENNLINTGDSTHNRTNIQHNPVFKYRIEDTFIVISLIYKDLNDYGVNFDDLNEKSKEIIRLGTTEVNPFEKPDFKSQIDIKNKL